MYSYETKIRIRYADTDKMGFAYYGNYPQYYEVGRTEMLRSLGYSYRLLEDKGILMPVVNLNVHYFKPAFYDDEITIKTSIVELPTVRMRFEYEIYKIDGSLINKGETTLGFINAKTGRPVRAPQVILDCLLPYFTAK